MHALSIVASIFALVRAAKVLVEGLKKLRRFYKSPAEVHALINEIEDLRLLIEDIDRTQHEHTLCTDIPAHSKILEDAYE
jgi:hypothetical protein